MVLFGGSVVFVSWSSLQGGEPVCHDCLVVNGTSKLIINISSRHGCSSGHPPESITKVLTYGH